MNRLRAAYHRGQAAAAAEPVLPAKPTPIWDAFWRKWRWAGLIFPVALILEAAFGLAFLTRGDTDGALRELSQGVLVVLLWRSWALNAYLNETLSEVRVRVTRLGESFERFRRLLVTVRVTPATAAFVDELLHAVRDMREETTDGT